VSAPEDKSDYWRLPAFILWVLFFLVGLAPEPVFMTLREWSGVLPQRAVVNSPHLITVAFAGYVALFCWHRCRDAGLSHWESQDRALQLGVVALVAFLPVDFLTVFTAHTNPLVQHRFSLYLVGIGKLATWWLSMFVRYYAFGADRVFAHVPSLFPSARRAQRVEKREAALHAERARDEHRNAPVAHEEQSTPGQPGPKVCG
jgi:hypothetical protein